MFNKSDEHHAFEKRCQSIKCVCIKINVELKFGKNLASEKTIFFASVARAFFADKKNYRKTHFLCEKASERHLIL